ncbi:Methyltransferase domain-containing protein [Anaerocolumna jejuensis DSM 15929]|uniref:Methyltransferase domain-containing protein n=1 Tax=Anaerocolumna jejuensis DSM 15929 TaxID=1121322 RepID=A0A1M6M2A0_9FIRM|nr:class I SAM-dependent methyltransferase [Anaerocolumna jejuensis]SHJ77561.1 Methyltransferase domain-containing protein [Anaerocolumna jejuensis DSM 15929]
MNEVIDHYDKLIEENNDPFYDPKPLREYMDKWDGIDFIKEMQLAADKKVLEIGIGTGRIANRVAPLCKALVGIDMSPKTIEKATENLIRYNNIILYCADFMKYDFDCLFDVIYSSLTFMHIKEKQMAISKVAKLMKSNARLVLSIDKNQSEYIQMDNRKIKIYPDNRDEICSYIERADLQLKKQYETEFAYIFVAIK